MTEHLARLGMENRVRQHIAPLVWAELMGPQVAAATEVEKVQDGVLYVCAKSATWASELTFYKADMLRRLNERLTGSRRLAESEPVITDIRFLNRGPRRKQGTNDIRIALAPTSEELDDMDLSPREAATIETSIAGIGDHSLRERMRKTRITAAKLQTWRLDNGWGPCPNCGELAPPRQNSTDTFDGRVDCPRCRIAWNLGR